MLDEAAAPLGVARLAGITVSNLQAQILVLLLCAFRFALMMDDLRLQKFVFEPLVCVDLQEVAGGSFEFCEALVG